MALITCPECGRQISNLAESCPGCGYPISKKKINESFESDLIEEELLTAHEYDEQQLESEDDKPLPKSSKTEKVAGIIMGISVACMLTSPIVGFVGSGVAGVIGFMIGFFGAIFAVLLLRSETPEEELEAAKKEYSERAKTGIVSGPTPDYLNIDYVQIVAQESRKSMGSAVARGAVGAAVAGPVGVAAAATAKNIGKTTFLVVTKQGDKSNVIVETNGIAFERLCAFIKN